jgi:hypothetical protein
MALAAILSFSLFILVFPVHCEHSYAGSAHAMVDVSARVVSRFNIKIIRQVSRFIITRFDISRGYVDITDALHFELTSNNPRGYAIAFDGTCSPFKALVIKTGGSDTYLAGCQGFVQRPYVRGTETVKISYRIILSANARPGVYVSDLYVGQPEIMPYL